MLSHLTLGKGLLDPQALRGLELRGLLALLVPAVLVLPALLVLQAQALRVRQARRARLVLRVLLALLARE